MPVMFMSPIVSPALYQRLMRMSTGSLFELVEYYLMTYIKNSFSVIAVLIASLLLTACGGGGGGDSAPPPPPANNSNWDGLVWDKDTWG